MTNGPFGRCNENLGRGGKNGLLRKKQLFIIFIKKVLLSKFEHFLNSF